MKTFFSLIALSLLASTANAATLRCASKKGESLYYTDGQLVLLVKNVVDDELMYGASLALLPEAKLGAKESKLQANARSNEKYVRFDLGGDAWCSYRLTLPRGFTEKEGQGSFPAFVDAYCEENSNYSIRMSCSI